MNKNEKLDIHTGIACAIIFSVVAIIMAICALARNNERTLGFDYLGVIVGVLALLVTFLVGWQIYTTIGITHKMANAERKIEIGETRIKNMLQNIEKVKVEIDKISDSSKDMIVGSVRLSTAMSLFYDTLWNEEMSELSKIDNYVACYKLSAGAMALFLNTSKGGEIQTIFNNTCLQILNLSGKIIFDEKMKSSTRMAFSHETHQICDNHYLNIIRRYEKLNDDQQRMIEINHLKRTSLLNKNEHETTEE